MPGDAGAYRVLIVGDEHSHSESLAEIFSMRGNLVKTAYCAEQAIEIVVAWKPALAIVDVVLPKMNGIDLAVLIQENQPSCHVILVSGRLIATAELEQEMTANGSFFNILAKPMPVNELLETASALLSPKAKPDA